MRFTAASVVFVLAATASGRAVPQPEGAGPFIPSFWDPQAAVDKPDLSRLDGIRFVTGNDYPPFNVTLPDGTLTGFNVDLARAICAELEVTCTIQARAWSELREALTERKADAAIGSMSVDDRAPALAFTAPYYKTPARFIIRRVAAFGSVGPTELRGKRIGVQTGTAHEAYLTRFFPGAVVVPFSSIDAARAALKTGKVDAVFGDAIGASLWLAGSDAGDCCDFAGGPYTESRFFGPGAGIAVRRDDDLLRRALDYALVRIDAKGTYGDIYLRYFPISPY